MSRSTSQSLRAEAVVQLLKRLEKCDDSSSTEYAPVPLATAKRLTWICKKPVTKQLALTTDDVMALAAGLWDS